MSLCTCEAWVTSMVAGLLFWLVIGVISLGVGVGYIVYFMKTELKKERRLMGLHGRVYMELSAFEEAAEHCIRKLLSLLFKIVK